jgi:hypothetical protein
MNIGFFLEIYTAAGGISEPRRTFAGCMVVVFICDTSNITVASSSPDDSSLLVGATVAGTNIPGV